MSAEQTPSGALSDGELVRRLLDRQEGHRWTVGDLVAVEERGYDFLAEEPQLKAEVQAVLAEHQNRARKALAPMLESLAKTDRLFKEIAASQVIPPATFAMPTDPQFEFEWHNSPAIRQAETLERIEELQGRTIETLAIIAAHTRRDAFQRILFGSAVVVAVASVIAAVKMFF